MSKLWINQDFETDTSPLSLAGTMARSTTNAITTTSLRGGDGTAKDGTAIWTPATADRTKSGSAKGLRIQARFKLKRVTTPSGGTVNVFLVSGLSVNWGLQVLAGTDVLRASGVNGATALGTGVRTIDVEYREERVANSYVKILLDGAVEIETHTIGTAVEALHSLNLGVSASGKCTWEFVWDDMKVWVARDPT